MTMLQLDPFSEMTSLRQAMDRLLENSFIRPDAGHRVGADIPVDLLDQTNALIVKASLPGVKPDDIAVQIQNNMLTISGEYHEDRQAEQGRYYLTERRVGRFSRAIGLPMAVDANACEAALVDGVLTLTLPKAEQARTKHIPIQQRGHEQLAAVRSPTDAPAEPAPAGRA